MSMVLLLASLLREKKVRSIKLVMQQSNQPNASNKAKNQQTFTISTKTDVILCIWQQLIQRFSMVFFFVFLCCFGCSVIFFSSLACFCFAFVLLLFCVFVNVLVSRADMCVYRVIVCLHLSLSQIHCTQFNCDIIKHLLLSFD